MKGQVFTLDLLIGLLITITALLSVVLFFPTPEPPFTTDAERMNVLMSEGVPEDWTVATLAVPGFLTDGRFNETKIAAFATLTDQEQRVAVGAQSNFTIRFYENGTQLSLCATCGVQPLTYKELLPIRRYGVLNSSIVYMEVRIYR
jgi:hypothetical protein